MGVNTLDTRFHDSSAEDKGLSTQACEAGDTKISREGPVPRMCPRQRDEGQQKTAETEEGTVQIQEGAGNGGGLHQCGYS